jgi:hypothetical protein
MTSERTDVLSAAHNVQFLSMGAKLNASDQKENPMRVLRYVGSAVALVAAMATAAQAQDTAEARRLTILTFSAPVQLPGMTLPAGSYRFEMADINNASHTVRVLSEDGQKVHGTFSTMSSTLPQRDLKDQNTLVMFAERPAGQPQAAREWYYPGRSSGEEFIYPKQQAQAIANANNTSVAASDEGKITRVEPDSANAGNAARAPADTASNAPAASAAPSRSAESTQAAAPAQPRTPAAVGTAGQAPAQQAQPEPARTLPRTASDLALYQLLSGLSLVAALGVRQYRIRVARG